MKTGFRNITSYKGFIINDNHNAQKALISSLISLIGPIPGVFLSMIIFFGHLGVFLPLVLFICLIFGMRRKHTRFILVESFYKAMLYFRSAYRTFHIRPSFTYMYFYHTQANKVLVSRDFVSLLSCFRDPKPQKRLKTPLASVYPVIVY